MPWKSKQLTGLKMAITGVTNTTPGSHPTVSFTVTDNAGNPVAPSKLNSLNLAISGPTSDYGYLLPATGFQGAFGDTPGNNPWFESALTATGGPSVYTYTMTGTIPSNAQRDVGGRRRVLPECDDHGLPCGAELCYAAERI